MTELRIDEVIDRWHAWLRDGSAAGLDELLADDVVFYSPIVYTPQRGRAITAQYLLAARSTLPGDASGSAAGDRDRPDHPPWRFRYTKQVLAGDTAVLEFETTVAGTYVNGVDIIRADDDGRIVEFRVMVRPLRAVNLVHQQMAATLEAMGPPGG